MKKVFLHLLLSVIVISSCTNADPKKMASDLCDCVNSEKKLSSEEQKIVVKAAKSGDDFQTALQTEIQKIEDQEKMQKVNDNINAFLLAIQSKKVMTCAEEIDKKNRVMKSDEKEMQNKLVSEMQEVSGCEAYAAILKKGMAQKTGDNTATDDTNEDEPKKKKNTEEE